MNGVLRRFQQYFSHITATAHIIHVFPGFHQYQAGHWSVLPKYTSAKKPRGSSAAPTQDPLITSQTLYYWAMQDPGRIYTRIQVFIKVIFSIINSFFSCNQTYLTHYQTTNFRLFQTERVCRRQFRIWQKWQIVIQTNRKHCGKRRNCSLRAIAPFPTVFSKGLFPRGVKRCHCVGMG